MKQLQRDLQNLSKLAGARREADMRRLFGNGWKTISESKAKWVRYMLTVWGDHMRGDCAPASQVNVIGRLMMRTEWSEQKGRQIEEVVTALHCQGYRDDELLRKARDIIIPESSVRNIIALAKESDDAAFMERVITTTLGAGSPVLSLARLRYCNRKSAQAVNRALINLTGITSKESRNRIEWAENILEGELFYASKREIEKEFLNAA
ncbi:TPA: hypothetical protein RQO74_000238 [Klebsiella michiganensis]|nr:hypothetical protein [Klebsiella michiganensis]